MNGTVVARWSGQESFLKSGQTLMTHCIVPLPELPFDWRSPPVEFRAIAEPAPQHSEPLPPPKPE